MASLLICDLSTLRSASFPCSPDMEQPLLVFQSSNAEESVFTLEIDPFVFVCVVVAAAMASMLLAWLSLEPKKRRGCDFNAVLRSCKASWR
uniref:Uncharacterized protein n=1 Tax=Lotus japonicus TaxID=34305 RepID=I3SKP8_LOTJA|nr:unknown [Lotus japonicus]